MQGPICIYDSYIDMGNVAIWEVSDPVYGFGVRSENYS
jgi:hypothetical protein